MCTCVLLKIMICLKIFHIYIVTIFIIPRVPRPKTDNGTMQNKFVFHTTRRDIQYDKAYQWVEPVKRTKQSVLISCPRSAELFSFTPVYILVRLSRSVPTDRVTQSLARILYLDHDLIYI